MENPKNHGEQTFSSEDDLERLLLAGLNSGKGIEANEEFWEKQRQRILDRQAKGRREEWKSS